MNKEYSLLEMLSKLKEQPPLIDPNSPLFDDYLESKYSVGNSGEYNDAYYAGDSVSRASNAYYSVNNFREDGITYAPSNNNVGKSIHSFENGVSDETNYAFQRVFGEEAAKKVVKRLADKEGIRVEETSIGISIIADYCDESSNIRNILADTITDVKKAEIEGKEFVSLTLCNLKLNKVEKTKFVPCSTFYEGVTTKNFICMNFSVCDSRVTKNNFIFGFQNMILKKIKECISQCIRKPGLMLSDELLPA